MSSSCDSSFDEGVFGDLMPMRVPSKSSSNAVPPSGPKIGDPKKANAQLKAWANKWDDHHCELLESSATRDKLIAQLQSLAGAIATVNANAAECSLMHDVMAKEQNLATRALIEAGIDPLAPHKCDPIRNVVASAPMYDEHMFVEWLYEHLVKQGRSEALCDFLNAGPTPVLKKIIDKHRAPDEDLSTLAALAAAFGADVTAPLDKHGYGALHLACKKGRSHIGIVSALLDTGVDVDLRTADGITPLHAATKAYDCSKTICLLLANGADPDARTDNLCQHPSIMILTPLGMAENEKNDVAADVLRKWTLWKSVSLASPASPQVDGPTSSVGDRSGAKATKGDVLNRGRGRLHKRPSFS
ncbi:ankyrin repeat protein [Mollivirus sibericum]|uniref:ankyrin repeat protein n=1 Tax=Mollivirus sibericum TaxID=1678078 RepID=UPI0006B2ED9C|nr:ankyrin repeat protein [Mollivirus sibericum]ALD61957.1 ankyrin repeat protein [Mollivirus sibericum]